jgi:hypothetical protein
MYQVSYEFRHLFFGFVADSAGKAAASLGTDDVGGAPEPSQVRRLAAQGLHLGGAIEAEQAAGVRRRGLSVTAAGASELGASVGRAILTLGFEGRTSDRFWATVGIPRL